MSLIDELRDEADLCRNETAVDVANLLDKAADEIERLHKAFDEIKDEAAHYLPGSTRPTTLEELAHFVYLKAMVPNA